MMPKLQLLTVALSALLSVSWAQAQPVCVEAFDTGKAETGNWPSLRWTSDRALVAKVQNYAHLSAKTPSHHRPAQRAWSPKNFSNPELHDPLNFRYIAHGVRGVYVRGAERSQLTERSLLDAARIVAAADETPLKILSCSVISNEHSATYYPAGFILEVPKENFIAAKAGGFGIVNNWRIASPENQAELQSYIDGLLIGKVGLDSPSAILSESSHLNNFNEVGLLRRGVNIKGIFIHAPNSSKDFDLTIFNEYRIRAEEAAKVLKVPVIVLP